MAHARRAGRTAFGWRFWLGGACTLLLASCLGLLAAGLARAADDDGWRVGRIAATQGRVWLLDRPDTADAAGRDDERWHDGSLAPLINWPLGRGDQLRTAPDGRATVQIDTLTLRLGADTELRIEQLDAARVVLWLPRGDLALHVLAEPARRAIELRTPEGRLWPLHAGHYRASRVFDSTQASAWAGSWRFDADDSALTVGEGRRADFWLQGQPPRTHYAWADLDRDAFADWARRDARDDLLPPPVQSPELAGLPGAGELQRWGDWRDDPEAGRVWLPRDLPPDWAPYQAGRWAWVAPWGWTWIDAAPWGFAPFHYGQWLVISGRWAWTPGPRVERRRYVPVLPGWGHEVPRQPPPPRGWPRRDEPPRARPPHDEPPRALPPRSEPPRVQPPRGGPPRVETPRVETPRAEPPPRVEPPPAAPPRAMPPRSEPSRPDAPRMEPPRVEPPRPSATPPAPAAPRMEPRPEPRPEPRLEGRPLPRPEVRPETRPEVRPDVRPPQRPEPRPDVRTEPRAEPRQESRPAPAPREEREPRRGDDRVPRAPP